MRHGIPVVMIFVMGLTLVLGCGLFAQVKKDQKTGQDRIEGKIQAIDKAKSSLTVMQSTASKKATWQVVFNSKTKITTHSNPAKVDDLKVGRGVIVLGKYDQKVMTAAQIDIRK
jgi:hypothetical protein